MQIYYPPEAKGLNYLRWLGIVTGLVTGLPLVLWLQGGPFPGKGPVGVLILATFVGCVAPLWHYYRSFQNLAYHLGGEGLEIRWGFRPVIIPYAAIAAVQPGQINYAVSRIVGIALSDLRQGVFTAGSLGEGTLYTVGKEIIWIQTGDTLYGISPADREGFLAALEQKRAELGLTWSRQATRALNRPRPNPFKDKVAMAGIIAGVALMAGMWVYVAAKIPQLPEKIPMHYNLAGQVDRWGPPVELYIMPAIALVSWFVPAIVGLVVFRSHQGAGRAIVWLSTATVIFLFFILAGMVKTGLAL